MNDYWQKQTLPGKCCLPYLDVSSVLQAPHGSLVILFVDVNLFAHAQSE